MHWKCFFPRDNFMNFVLVFIINFNLSARSLCFIVITTVFYILIIVIIMQPKVYVP